MKRTIDKNLLAKAPRRLLLSAALATMMLVSCGHSKDENSKPAKQEQVKVDHALYKFADTELGKKYEKERSDAKAQYDFNIAAAEKLYSYEVEKAPNIVSGRNLNMPAEADKIDDVKIAAFSALEKREEDALAKYQKVLSAIDSSVMNQIKVARFAEQNQH